MEQGRVYEAVSSWATRYRVHLDVAAAAVLLLLSWAATGPSPVAGLLAVLQIAPLALRRVIPITVTLVVAGACVLQLVLIDFPLASNIAVPIVLYTVTSLATRSWQRYGVLALGLAGVVLGAMRWETGWGGTGEGALARILFLCLVLTLVVVPSWVLGDAVRNRRVVLRRLREQNEALARDRDQRAALAAQAERAGIAREMHDIVAHSLAVVVVQADGAAYATRTALAVDSEGSAPTAQGVSARVLAERAAGTLQTVADTARSALADTRRLVGVLREGQAPDAEYAPTDGTAGIQALVARVRTSGVDVGVDLDLETDEDDRPAPDPSLPREVDLAAYRIVQESLTNVLKHAGPRARAEVRVRRHVDVLEVEVVDDGRGGAVPDDGRGNGLVGMRERVGVLGGTLHAGPRVPAGFGVQATLPLRSAPEPTTPVHDPEPVGGRGEVARHSDHTRSRSWPGGRS